MVAKKGKFPTRRKAQCCGNKVEAGDAILLLPLLDDKGTHNIVLHRRCVVRITDHLPLDEMDHKSRFERLRQDILKSGQAFPERKRNGRAKPQ